MSQVFRVGDLAKQMGLSTEEMIFKLRSIGVSVTLPTDALDLATVRSIITGETLKQRRGEVIVRKEGAAEVEHKPQVAPVAAVDRGKRRRPGRRFDEEIPDQVPNLAAMSVPASPPLAGHPGEAASPLGPATAEEAVEAVFATEETAAVETAVAPVDATIAPAVEAEVVSSTAPVGEAPAASASNEVSPGAESAEASDAAPATAASAPTRRRAAHAKTTKDAAAAAPAQAPTPRTPFERGARELSPEEVKQQILAAKTAQKAAAEKRTAVPGRKTSDRKSKAAADADQIKELLKTFDNMAVRATTDAPPSPRPSTPTSNYRGGGARPSHRLRRERESPAEARVVTVTFRDGVKPAEPVILSEAITLRELAEKFNILVKDLMAFLISRKVLVTANQALPQSLTEQIAEWIGIEALVVSIEEEIGFKQQEEATEATGQAEGRPPVVTVMGHVDHGKTSLLDAIRSTRVAAGEAGGITQHIGASRVLLHGRPVMFIDTPGHEAFTQMRARGAKVTDIVVLVVAADDGVMPQTIEAINHARAAKVPIIVAINKIDKPNANPDKVRQELTSYGLQLEGWGGDTPVVEVSAVKKQGIDDLLEVILLQAEVQDLKAVKEGFARGTILEARKEKGRGVVATVLVQHGTLKTGDTFFSGATYGRIRAMLDTARKPVRHANPSDAVEIMGFENIPEAGDTFQSVENEARAREVAAYRRAKQREDQMAGTSKVSLEGFMEKIKSDEVKALNIVLKADVQGSVEVLKDTLTKLSTPEVQVNILHASAGAITANDVLLASASQAVVIGFNVRPERSAKDLAEREGVDIRLHTVIYHLTEELQKALAGMLAPVFKDEDLGRAEVRETFKVTKIGTIAGCRVTEGTIHRSAKVRLLRDNVVVWQGGLSSLKHFKEDATEIKSGFECGIGLEKYQDIKVGDVIEAYRVVEVARES